MVLYLMKGIHGYIMSQYIIEVNWQKIGITGVLNKKECPLKHSCVILPHFFFKRWEGLNESSDYETIKN